MNKKLKAFRKLLISHQLEALVVVSSVVLLIIGLICNIGLIMIPIILLLDLLILKGPDIYSYLSSKFNKNKKTTTKKRISKNLEKKEDVKMAKKRKKKKTNKGFGKKLFKGLLMFFLCMMIIGFVAVLLFFSYVVKNAPNFDPQNLYKAESTILYFSDGTEMAKIGSETREKVNYNEVSENLINAIIATEDSRFFQHNGFDLPRFLKASVMQVMGIDAGGASTLTMQIAKNGYTSTEDRGFAGIVRKFTDIYLSIFKIEKKYSKPQILEFYFNSYYLGGGAHGVEQASLNYFGKHASDLSLAEASAIAGLFQSPGAYDLFKYPERATTRRNTVLRLMVRHGYITQEEADMASAIKIEDLLVGKDESNINNEYQGFIDTVVEEIKDDLGKNPYSVSMEVYTTVDKRVQDIINNIMSGKTFAWENAAVQAGVSVTDPQTGAIVGVAGGRDSSKALSLNRGTSSQFKRQIGSTSKPLFDYAPSIEFNNTSTYTLLGDEEYTYSDGHNISNYDAGYKGLITSREAVVDSRNIPALKTFQKVDKKNIIKMVTNMGLSPELDSTGTFIHEAHAIGGYNGESPLTVGAAYNTFSNGGYYIEPYSYTKIIFRDTDEEYEQKIEKKRVMSEETAYMMYSMLESTTQGAMRNFSNNVIRKRYAAKTGTSNFDQATKDRYGLAGDAVNDLWLVGQTDEFCISLWYGYDKINSSHYTHFGNIQNLYLFSALAKDIFTRDSKVTQPKGVVNVTVERGTIEPMLPSAYTPDYLKITEMFKKGTEPTKVSPRFGQLENVSGISGSSSGSKVTLQWDKIKTPDMANDTYLTKYYGKVFTKPHWIQSQVGNHLAVTGTLGYDVYEKNENGSLTLVGSTTSNSIDITPKFKGVHAYIIKSAYSGFKSNASSGVQYTITGGIDVSYNNSVTLSDSATGKKGNEITTDDISSVNINGSVVTSYSAEVSSFTKNSVTFKITYDGKSYSIRVSL